MLKIYFTVLIIVTHCKPRQDMSINCCISDLINIELIELLGGFEFRTEVKLKVTDNETAL